MGTRNSPSEHERRFKIVLFDAGGTLIHFDGDVPSLLRKGEEAFIENLLNDGLPLDYEVFLKKFHSRMEAYYTERESEFIEYTTAYIARTLLAEYGFPNVSEDILKRALARMYAVTQSYWLAEDDAIPTLKDLLAQGYRLGLVSNAADGDDVQTLINQVKLRPYFDVILTSAALGIRKPNPIIFQEALKYWGASPEVAVMVGDTLGADILGARNAGIFSIWLTRRADTPANRAHLDTIQPDAAISKLSELPGMMATLEASFD